VYRERGEEERVTQPKSAPSSHRKIPNFYKFLCCRHIEIYLIEPQWTTLDMCEHKHIHVKSQPQPQTHAFCKIKLHNP